MNLKTYEYVAGIGVLLFLFSLGCTADPSVTWNKPADASRVFGTVQLQASLSGGGTGWKLQFYQDSVDASNLIASGECDDEQLCSADWFAGELENGDYALFAVVQDADNRTAVASITATVANLTRAETIPADAVKMTPEADAHPPVLSEAFRDTWEDPVPLGAPINTAGGEDSPFITSSGDEFYFFFTPDVSVPPEQQVDDQVTGVYRSLKQNGSWSEPEQIYLSYHDVQSLNGAQTVWNDEMWFATARADNYKPLDIWIAQREQDRWAGWVNAGELLNLTYEIGELHITSDGTEIYFDSQRSGGLGEKDIWVTRLADGIWQEPESIDAVNTEYTEGWPYVTEDGNQLWFTRAAVAPEVYMSTRVNGQWQTPELVLSSLAGENTFDADGNLYFVHHYWDDASNSMIEADIYVCYRK